MSIKIADRVKETSLTQGTGTLTLNGAFGGFQSFSSAIGDGNSTYYAIENESKWEVGIGTYTSSSNTLSRDTVLKSSSGTSKITISGVAIVFCSYPADKAVIRDENGNIPEDGLLTLTRDSAGNFIHMYKDDSYDRTISIYTDGNASPGWRMGVKNSPSSETEAPSEGYVYGKDGQVGLVGNSSNSITLSNTTDFTVKHNNASLIKASASTGIHLNANSAAYPAITINGAAAQSQPLTEWTDSAGNVLSIVDKDGNIGVNRSSASYELDVTGSGRFTSVIFADATEQSTAYANQEVAVSGWARSYVDNQDHSGGGGSAADILANSASGVVISGIANTNVTNIASNLVEVRANSASGVVISGIANTNVTNIASNLVEVRANSASGVVISGIANTAYGWGDHSLQSYSTSDTTYAAGSGLELHGTTFQAAISGANLLATNTPTDDYVPSYDAATGKLTWVANAGGGGATYTAGSGLVLDGDNKFHSTFASGNYLLGEIRDNSSSGVVISGIANANVSNIASNLVEIRANSASGVVISGIAETAYGWGDHSLQSYSTSDTTYTPGSGLELHGTEFQAAISGANLLATNTPSDNQLASYDAATGKFTWVSAGASYTLPEASASAKGGIELFSDTDQSVAATAVSATASRTYGLQLNSDGQGVVNVPWVDTNTTYSEATDLAEGLMSTAHHDKLDGIATSANNYSLPSASDTVVGGVELATTTETTTGTDTTRAVTPAGVQAAIDALIGGAPGALDTLNELAAAISDDASYASTITTALSAKAPIASPTFTGTVAIPNVADLETAVVANTAKLTNVSTDLGVTTSETTVIVTSSDGTDATIPVATTSVGGVMSKAIFDQHTANVSKNTNVSTALSTGTVNATSYGITSDGGSDDIVLAQATTSAAGLLSAAKWDEIVANTAKDTANTANVEAAGALMDSELIDLAGVKAVTISTLQVKPSEGAFANGDKTKLDGIDSGAKADQTQADINALAITTVGTIAAGAWQGTAIADGYIASAATWNAKQAALTFGIANTNAVKIDAADVADDEYARFTANGLESRTIGEIKTDLLLAKGDVGLGNVENTALSTWAGTTDITTVGTISNGTWQGTAIAQAYIADNAISLAKMAGLARGSIIIGDSGDDPKALAAGTEDYVLTMDSNGDAVWAAAGGGGSTAADDIGTGDAAVSIVTTVGNITLDAQATDADIIFKVDDADTSITALTLDGSEDGAATFKSTVTATGFIIGSTAITSTAAELNILDGVTSTAGELNILDGVTSTAAELNILDGVTSTAAELNILDGVTSTAAELNILDGVTATATEINLIDGVTATTTELNYVDVTAGTATASKAVVLDGSKNIATIGTVGCGAITSTGSSSFATSVKTPAIQYTDGDLAMTVNDGGSITLAKATIGAVGVGSLSGSDTDVTIDWATGNYHEVTLDTANIDAVIFHNVTVGQRVVIRIQNDHEGARTITWTVTSGTGTSPSSATVSWAGGTAPTMTATVDKADTYGFICRSATTFDGFVIGQNI